MGPMGGTKRGKGTGTWSSKTRVVREAGIDTAGAQYNDIDAMWAAELADGATAESGPVSQAEWYTKAKAYWDTQQPTVDGMLGGLEKVHPVDVVGSKTFLTALDVPSKDKWANAVALDVGGGIGRISKHVLSSFFGQIDLMDSNQSFIEKSKEYAAECQSLDRRICCPMEDFQPEPGRYSLVWIQWCIIYLTDDDLVRFLQSFAQADVPLVVVKDNVTTKGFIVDKEDSSVTRSDAHMKKLFARAGWFIVTEQLQQGFPQDLFDVKMYALSPDETVAAPPPICPS